MATIVLFVAGVAAAGAAPAVGRAVRARGGDRCGLDGAVVDPATRVRVIEAGSESHAFCCVPCAERWIDESAAIAREILVTDETTGNEVNARTAWFVWLHAAGVSKFHAFADERDARRHAEAFGGTVLSGDERPFRGKD